jgi:two-component system, LytTR family, response regulator
MIKAILIDDEKNALDVLEMQLANYCSGITIAAKCDGGEKGIAAIRQHEPDLVFLDIEMPLKNGFDVLAETKGLVYEVIFTTAYDQFAVKAFKYAAVDYLLKPVDILELQAAVEKVKSKNGAAGIDKKLQSLFEQFGFAQAQAPVPQRIALPVGDAMQLFAPDDIIRCESDSNYTSIWLAGGKKLLLAKTLKEIEETLRGLSFFRVHQSHLVNMNHISKVVKGESSYLIMSDGNNIPISRNKKEAFMEMLRRV